MSFRYLLFSLPLLFACHTSESEPDDPELSFESHAVSSGECPKPSPFRQCGGLAWDYTCSALSGVCFDVERASSPGGPYTKIGSLPGSGCCCRSDGSAVCYWAFPNCPPPSPSFYRVGAHFC